MTIIRTPTTKSTTTNNNFGITPFNKGQIPTPNISATPKTEIDISKFPTTGESFPDFWKRAWGEINKGGTAASVSGTKDQPDDWTRNTDFIKQQQGNARWEGQQKAARDFEAQQQGVRDSERLARTQFQIGEVAKDNDLRRSKDATQYATQSAASANNTGSSGSGGGGGGSGQQQAYNQALFDEERRRYNLSRQDQIEQAALNRKLTQDEADANQIRALQQQMFASLGRY